MVLPVPLSPMSAVTPAGIDTSTPSNRAGLPGVREPQAGNGQPAFTRLQQFLRAVRQRAAGIVHPGGAQPAPSAQGVVVQQVKAAPLRNPAFPHDKHAIRYAFQPVQPMIHHKDRHTPRFEFGELARPDPR